MSSIEWVQDSNGNQGKTWNPITGCKKVSPELLTALSAVIEIVATAHKNEAGQYWRSISSELLSFAHERRTGA